MLETKVFAQGGGGGGVGGNLQDKKEKDDKKVQKPKQQTKPRRKKQGSIHQNPTDPVMIIDQSYYLFYRYYALQRWYSLSQNRMVNAEDVLGDTLFMEKFTDLYKRSIDKLCKKYKVREDRVVLALDCDRKSIWRNEFYGEYKSSRSQPSNFDPKIFGHVINEIIPSMTKIKSIYVPKCEADDVAAVVTKYIRNTSPDTPIIIITNDKDYLQLYDEKTSIINLQNKNLGETGKYDKGETYLLHKLITGDKSDCIQPISKKGCNVAAVETYLSNPEKLEAFLQSDPSISENFEMNRRLIDMNMIPQELQVAIVEKFERLPIVLKLEESDK